jgi:ribosomal protein S18 acetylase RimI-like enzyme
MSTPSSHTQFTIRGASKEDESQILTLLPYLADFDIPIRRSSADLWAGDADLAKTILSGNAPSSFIDVAERDGGTVEGLIMVSLREELLSHAPSAHLEAIVVAPNARGTGLGKRLMMHCEGKVRQRGASSLTLHVFSRNARARALYASEGFDEELVRAIKWLD